MLIVGLIFIILLTAVVMAVMRGATLQERMAANVRNQQFALQAAEAVIRNAETTLFTTAPFDPFDRAGFTDVCTSAYCAPPAANSTPRWKTVTWTDTSASAKTRSFSAVTSNLTLPPGAIQPRYFVEYLGQEGGQSQKICPILSFRITARGTGADGAETYVETVYRYRPATFIDGSCG